MSAIALGILTVAVIAAVGVVLYRNRQSNTHVDESRYTMRDSSDMAQVIITSQNPKPEPGDYSFDALPTPSATHSRGMVYMSGVRYGRDIQPGYYDPSFMMWLSMYGAMMTDSSVDDSARHVDRVDDINDAQPATTVADSSPFVDQSFATVEPDTSSSWPSNQTDYSPTPAYEPPSYSSPADTPSYTDTSGGYTSTSYDTGGYGGSSYDG